jgi:ribonuclease P protein component
MAGHPNRFPKTARLSRRSDIEELFRAGKSFQLSPFRILYRIPGNGPGGLLMAIAVPKRNVRLATRRNRIKRLVREAWRANRGPVSEKLAAKGVTVHIMMVYQGTPEAEYDLILGKIILILRRLSEIHEGAVG